MQCLNVKDKEVAALLEEYTNILGNENAAYYVLSENNGYGLDKAPNGADSKLFSDLLNHYNGDRNKAILAKSRVYSDSFRNWFGDWTKNVSKVDLLYEYDDLYGKDTIYGRLTTDLLDNFISASSVQNVVRTLIGGNYNAGTKTLTLATDSTTESRNKVNTHELVHVASSLYAFAYEKHKGILKEIYHDYDRINQLLETNNIELTESQIKSFDTLSNIKDKAAKYISDNPSVIEELNKKYPTGNASYFMIEPSKYSLHEFISEAFTNPQLMEVLKNIPYKTNKTNETLFSKFIELVAKIFNLDGNALGRTFEEAHNILSEGAKNKTDVSKVVDENGEPLIVWHNTDVNNITEFKSYVGSMGEESGMFFSSDSEYTSQYGDVTYPVYLSIKKPYILQGNNLDRESAISTRMEDIIENRRKTIDGIIGHDTITDEDLKKSTGTEYVAFTSNQIKSIDNHSNIYNQEAQSQTGTGRNEELALILSELYPNIEVGQLNNPNLRGQAQVEGYMAGRVLLNSLLENQDTLPHEYAHHYIAWFRNAPIVQKGIEKFGSEESLVQAIGENSVKAIRWYNRFFNWIKGLFSSKQRVLNSLTNSFLRGEPLSYGSLIKTEIHNQQAKQIPSGINKIYDKIMTGLERRIADIEFSKFKGNRENSLIRLQFRMNQLENDKATLEFVDYMNDDIATQKRELSRMLDAYRLYKSNGTPHGITQEQLDVIRKGYIGFYDNLITNLQNVIDDESSFEYFNDPKLIEQTLDSIKLTLSDFNESVRIFNRIVDSIAKDNMLDNASRISDYTRAQLDKIFDEGDFELSWWDRYIGQTQYINDPLVQLLLNKLVTAKNEVYDEKLKVGKKLLDLSSKVSPSDIKLLQERDKDGKRTGYLVSALNRGAHRAAYMSFLTNLANEMGYPNADVHTLPETLSDEEYRYWNARINEWDAANTERKFVPEYYEITNILSLEAKRRRDDINNELQLILLPTIDDEGNFHKEKLSDAEYAKYEALQTKRRNLANPFYEDGTEKLGIDKQVAQEFQEYNKRLSEKLKYKTNYEKFNKAYNKAKSELSEADFKKWIKRNTVVRITQAFYDKIKKLSSGKVKSAHQLTLEEARNNLLKLYTKPDGTVDIDSIPTNVKSMIIEYDSLINQESAQTQSEKKSEIYRIAEFKVDPRYLQQYEFYSKKGGAEFDAWLVQNTYTDAYGNIQPASFWKKLVPKAEFRKYYMERVPNRDWSEIDKESAFYNPNFDESYGESRIPKKSKYGNKDFEKVQNNPKLKVLYDAILDTKKESNSYIYFARFLNPYLLPQIDGGAWNTISRSDNVLKGLGLAALNAVTVQEKDEKYNKSKALRSDGTAVKLVPTRYLTQLDNPDTITDDVVGSIIHFYGMAYNYKRMSELAPEMETILDFTSRLDVKTDKGESLNTKSTRLYSKVEELINTFVYGMESDPLEVRIPKTNRKVSVDKILTGLANYTRKVGISQNLNVILTGMVTNKVMNRLEAITGLNYTNSELTAASVIIQKSYANALLNIGNANNKNKTLCFLEFTGVVRDADKTFKDLHNNRIVRALKQHFWYFGHEMSDYVTKGKMVIAIALHSKYIPEYNKFMTRNEFFRTVKDKKKANALWKTYSTTLYDAFEVSNNQLVVKDEFKNVLDERTINKFRNTCKQVGTKIDTQLTELDKNWIQANIFGKLLFIYRNFLIIGLQNKFLTKPQFNIVTGMFQDAQFHAAWKAIQTYLSKEKLNQLRELYKDNFEEVDEYNKAMLRRITTEIVFAYILSFIITTILRSLADDDKDDFFKNEMALIGARAGIELRSNIIPVEAINMFGNPSAAWSTLEYFYELSTAPFDDPMEKVTKGPYKGMYRYQRSLIKASPFRSIYEAQDPRSKLQYYNNFSLY